MVKHSNYWFQTHEPTLQVTAGLPRSIDVAIIGGGFSGYSLLYDLIINTNLSVVLLEAMTPAFHASGRNVGYISEVDPVSLKSLRRTIGDDVAVSYAEAVRINNEMLHAVIGREHIDCEYHKNGGFYITDVEQDENLKHFAEFSPESCKRLMSKNVLEAIVPCNRSHGGVFVPSEATLNPYKLVHGLHSACEELGRHVLLNSSVQRVVSIKDGLKVFVRNRGSFIARNVVHCTGAYSENLLREFKGNIATWKTHVISTTEIPEAILSSFPNHPITHLDRTARLHDGKMVLSGGIIPVTNPACDGMIEPASFQRLNSWWASVFSSIPKTVSAKKVWSYINCTGKDGLPLIGPIPNRPGEYLNVGCDANFTFVAAFMLRNYLTDGNDGNDQWTSFLPSRVLQESK